MRVPGSSSSSPTRVERLLGEVTTWRQPEDIRAYAALLEARLPDLGSDGRVRIDSWCRWALAWADRTDPSRHISLIAGLDDDGYTDRGAGLV